MKELLAISRRGLLAVATGAVVSMTMATASAAWAAPLDVAAVYNVPVEQQWVSRIHKAQRSAGTGRVSSTRRMSPARTTSG